MGWGQGECVHNCAPHMLFSGNNVRRTLSPVHTMLRPRKGHLLVHGEVQRGGALPVRRPRRSLGLSFGLDYSQRTGAAV